tara:strand:+ start:2072 stop:2395 length:324 start_codon:yes stop_codon:yes gene_type:complete
MKTKEEVLVAIRDYHINECGNAMLSFSCYADEIFSYNVTFNGVLHEINVITKDVLFCTMSIEDIIHLEDIGFIDYRVFARSRCTDVGRWSVNGGTINQQSDLEKANN